MSDPWRRPKGPPTPTKQDAKVAFKARTKQTLHGQLGTGNRISSVIQYPISTKDPGNMCAGRIPNHISAEDRRLLRVRVKYALRSLRGTDAFNFSVYNVEEQILRSFASCPEFLGQFYCDEAFADRLLNQTAGAVAAGQTMARTTGSEGVLRLSETAPVPPSTGTDKSQYSIPGGHHKECIGRCVCLKLQDAPLRSTPVEVVDLDTRKQKVDKAADKVVQRVTLRTAQATLPFL